MSHINRTPFGQIARYFIDSCCKIMFRDNTIIIRVVETGLPLALSTINVLSMFDDASSKVASYWFFRQRVVEVELRVVKISAAHWTRAFWPCWLAIDVTYTYGRTSPLGFGHRFIQILGNNYSQIMIKIQVIGSLRSLFVRHNWSDVFWIKYACV